jgi:hypothetical protein
MINQRDETAIDVLRRVVTELMAVGLTRTHRDDRDWLRDVLAVE